MWQENICLKKYNTFAVPATAAKFIRITSMALLKEVLSFYKNKMGEAAPVFVLSGGSNILFTKNPKGLVIYLDIKGIETVRQGDAVLVNAAGGESWHQLVLYAVNNGFGGIENLALIPGKAGAAPIQNIGAYGVEIKDVLARCDVLDMHTMQVQTFTNAQCGFGYRDSIFKKTNRYIILGITLRLTAQRHVLHTGYGNIVQQLAAANITQPTIADIAAAVTAIRKSKLPDPAIIPNAGSFFKNPVVASETFNQIKNIHADAPRYSMDGAFTKIPAAWLIEQTGWKGRQLGNVATHDTQPLVIINKTGNATGNEIYDFSTKIIYSVAEKFGIVLEREVNII